jgi:integrase
MIKTLLYTGIRVSELVHIKISDIDLDSCQIRINQGKGKKDRIVPFPDNFKEVIAIHMHNTKDKGSEYEYQKNVNKVVREKATDFTIKGIVEAEDVNDITFKQYLGKQNSNSATEAEKYAIEKYHCISNLPLPLI